MPTYLYQCTECSRKIEISHGITEEPVEYQMHIKFGGHGEACRGKLKRLIAGCSFVLKGSGWSGGNYS